MGLFDIFKKGKNTIVDNKPQGKSLEWFTSEAGLAALKEYTTPQSYILESSFEEEYDRKDEDCGFRIFLQVFHKDAKVPSLYFTALAKSLNAPALTLVTPTDLLVKLLKIMACPYSVNDDGEKEPRTTDLPLEHIVSIDNNPVLNFVRNFNIFEIKDDGIGSAEDKYDLYFEVLLFLSTVVKDIEIDNMQWLFDKNTYLDDLGTIRNKKGFFKKCKEVSDFPDYFEDALSELDK